MEILPIIKKANKINLDQLNKEILLRNSKTIFKKLFPNHYQMNSKTGIIELSYKDILTLIKNNKNPFFIFPDTGFRVKKIIYQSFRKNLCDATKKKISKLVLKNSYIK